MIFEKASIKDLDELGDLYNEVCEYLSENDNYPGWKKDIYPTKEDAETGIRENSCFVCRYDGKIAGTVILRHTPEEGYKDVNWLTKNDYSKIYVVYTLAVHPNYLSKGVGKFIMHSIEDIAKRDGCISIRLDVVKGNIPAENLYLRSGYQFIITKSLGYEAYGLPWYNLYEKRL